MNQKENGESPKTDFIVITETIHKDCKPALNMVELLCLEIHAKVDALTHLELELMAKKYGHPFKDLVALHKEHEQKFLLAQIERRSSLMQE